MANEIPISVVDRKIKVGRHVPATMTNIGKDYLSISLDDEWSSTDHRLRVTLYSESPYVSVQDWWDGKSAIEIPQEITSCPAFKITVANVSEDGYERLVTQAMDEPIENPRNGHDEGSEPGVRTMDIIARIDAIAADLEEKRDTDYWRGEPGAPGAPGEPGADGYSPTANVTKNGGTATITVTDKNGTTTATVSDGAPGSDAAATDVRIAGKSITADGVADIPLAYPANRLGLVKFLTNMNYGLQVNDSGNIYISKASYVEISSRFNNYAPITTTNFDYAVKAAMCDGHGAAWAADEQKAARERMNAADANKVYIMQKQIENLQGIAATEETDSTEAYTKTVPTGAQKWASIDKVGGKTVVWNQLVQNGDFSDPSGVSPNSGNSSVSVSNGIATVTAVNPAQYIGLTIRNQIKSKAGRKMLFLCYAQGIGRIGINGMGTNSSLADMDGTMKQIGAIYTSSSETSSRDALVVFNASLMAVGETFNVSNVADFDLTQMFGTGNEPATLDDPRIQFIKAYAEEHPEYNPGELMSAEVVEVESKGTFIIPDNVRGMCPGYGWSAGNVCNEIDFGRKVYVQRVASVDLGTLGWNVDTRYDNTQFYSGSIADKTIAAGGCICAKYSWVKNQGWASNVNKTIGFVGGAHQLLIVDNDYHDASAFKAAMSGVMLYYELAEPVEVDLSDVLTDDHYIEVEAGGTVTFKQASTQLPVPSSVTYQISTSEVIANA